MRLSSQGMAGTSHSAQATRLLSGDHAGSKQKSAPAERRTGHGSASASQATATSRPSST